MKFLLLGTLKLGAVQVAEFTKNAADFDRIFSTKIVRVVHYHNICKLDNENGEVRVVEIG